MTVTAEELRAVGDRVMVVARLRGTGRGSGVEVSERIHHVLTISNGKVKRPAAYSSRADALEAVGLTE